MVERIGHKDIIHWAQKSLGEWLYRELPIEALVWCHGGTQYMRHLG
jgi:hypothetical protein